MQIIYDLHYALHCDFDLLDIAAEVKQNLVQRLQERKPRASLMVAFTHPIDANMTHLVKKQLNIRVDSFSGSVQGMVLACACWHSPALTERCFAVAKCQSIPLQREFAAMNLSSASLPKSECDQQMPLHGKLAANTISVCHG